jgi:hypothetical protein
MDDEEIFGGQIDDGSVEEPEEEEEGEEKY